MTIHRLNHDPRVQPQFQPTPDLSGGELAALIRLLDRALRAASEPPTRGRPAKVPTYTRAERATLRQPLRLNPGAIGVQTLSSSELEAVKEHNDATFDPLAVKGGALTRQVQVGVLQERNRVEMEKFDFSPEERAQADKVAPKAEKKRLENNAKREKKIAELQSERAEIAKDPKLSHKDRAKKLEKLDEKIAKEARRIRPPFSLENQTAMTDQIMNDPSIPDEEKKKQIDEIRKDYGMKKRGKGSFSKLVAHRLGDIYKDSKKRVDKFGKDVEKAGKEQLKDIEKTYGKDSVQAQTFKADLEAAKKARSLESKSLDAKASTLKSMYPGFWGRVGNFFKGALKIFGKITDFISLPLKFIPGIGSVVSAVTSGLGGLAKLATGDWKGAISSFISAVPIPGTKALGSTVAGSLAKVGGKVTAKGASMAGQRGLKKVASKGLSKGGDWLSTQAPEALADAALRMPVKVAWDAGMQGNVFGIPIRGDGSDRPDASPYASSPTGSFTSLRDTMS